jgi:hypothetical protein
MRRHLSIAFNPIDKLAALWLASAEAIALPPDARAWGVPRVNRRLRVSGRRVAATVGGVGEIVVVLLVLSGGALAHLINIFNYPRYQLDEGTYIASAWAVAHGQISPYTYTYAHPPLGWAMMAAWIQVTGGFFTFGSAINTGRIFMVWIFVISALLVYLIARRLSNSPWAALLATTLFSFSPLSVNYQREVLLDNVATCWMLAAFFLLVISASRMRYLVASALALGIAILSKETLVVLFPVFVYGVWLQVSRFQRRFALIVFSYTCVALVSLFLLLAALKGELFPFGTVLGGSHQHVSLIETLLYQAGRGSNEGSIARQWASWWRDDRLLMVAGMVTLTGNLWLGWRKPLVRLIALLTLVYWMFLSRGGVTLAYYILPILPLQALNVALFAFTVVPATVQARWRSRRAPPTWLAPAVLILAMVLIIPHDLQQNRTNLTEDDVSPEVNALAWVGAHVPRSAVIVANHYAWVDLRSGAGPATPDGVPFDHAEMYWQVATDPAIRNGLLHNDWNNIDYVLVDSDVTTDAQNFHMDIILQAIQHATVAKSFQNRDFQVIIMRVQHRSAPGAGSSFAALPGTNVPPAAAPSSAPVAAPSSP